MRGWKGPDAMKQPTGKVYLVGAGPGAPDLITLRGADILGRADIVFHDALVHPDVLALAARAEKIAVGKRCGKFTTAQQFINKRLVDAARKHPVVVRLKGGDPMLFGRAHEEIEFLVGKGIPVKITPGITAALAAAADLGISLTRRGKARSVAFVTPRVGEGTAESSWVRAALAADTVAIYMGADELPEIAARLIVAGKSMATPVVVVENASMPDMDLTYGTLARLPRWESRGGPALVLIGDVYGEAAAEALRRGRLQASQSA